MKTRLQTIEELLNLQPRPGEDTPVRIRVAFTNELGERDVRDAVLHSVTMDETQDWITLYGSDRED